MKTGQKEQGNTFVDEEEKKETEKDENSAENGNCLMKVEFHNNNIIDLEKDLEGAFSKELTSKESIRGNEEYEEGTMKVEIETIKGIHVIEETKKLTAQNFERSMEKNEVWNNSSKRECNEKEQISEEIKSDYLQNCSNQMEMNNNNNKNKNRKKNETDENGTDENVTDKNVTDKNVTDKNVTDKNVTDKIDTDEYYSPNYENELVNKSKRKIDEIEQNEQNKKIKNHADSSNTSCNYNNEVLEQTDGTLHNSLNVTFREERKMESNQSSDIEKLENNEYHENTFVEEILEKYPRIFATRLPFEVTEKDLEKHFSKYGKIVDIYLSKNIKNNKNKGFGFISYETKEAMDQALQEKLHIIGGKEIVVDIASSRNQKKIFYLPSDHNLVNDPNVKNISRNKNFRNHRWNMERSHNYNLTKFDPYKREFKLYPGMNPHHTFIPNMNLFNKPQITNCKAMDTYSFKKIYSPQKYPCLGYSIKKNTDMRNEVNVQTPISNMLQPNFPNLNFDQNSLDYPTFSNFKNEYGHMDSNQMYMQNNLSNPNYIQHSSDLRSTNYNKDNHKQFIPQFFYKSNNNSSPPFMHKLPGGDEWNKRGYKLFVTKLNSATTVETVRNYFENFGEVIDVYFPNDPETNRPRGIAFVTFLDSECTKQILSKKDMKHIIDGKEVIVDLADPDVKHKKKCRGL